MNEAVHIPVWVWGILALVITLVLSILGFFVGNYLKRISDDIKSANQAAEKVQEKLTTEIKTVSIQSEKAKTLPCEMHMKSFERVHEEREKTTSKLFDLMDKLNISVGDLRLVTAEVKTSFQYLCEKHEDLNDRVIRIEGKMHD
jgi:uncharacterized protein YoxC